VLTVGLGSSRSIATLHAERIRARIKTLEPLAQPPLPPAAAPTAEVETARPGLSPAQATTAPIHTLELLQGIGAGQDWAHEEAWGMGFSNEAMGALTSMMSDPMLGGWSWGEGELDSQSLGWND
jgi:hypothetical protein